MGGGWGSSTASTAHALCLGLTLDLTMAPNCRIASTKRMSFVRTASISGRRPCHVVKAVTACHILWWPNLCVCLCCSLDEAQSPLWTQPVDTCPVLSCHPSCHLSCHPPNPTFVSGWLTSIPAWLISFEKSSNFLCKECVCVGGKPAGEVGDLGTPRTDSNTATPPPCL